MPEHNYRADVTEALVRCRRLRDGEAGREFYRLLHAATEQCREELVTARGERVLLLQGAVRKLRELSKSLEQNPVPPNREDGAYA